MQISFCTTRTHRYQKAENKVEKRTSFHDIEMAINERMKTIFEQLSERDNNYSSNNFEHQDECIEDSKKEDIPHIFCEFRKII